MVKTFLIAETLAFIATSIFHLPSSIFHLPSSIFHLPTDLHPLHPVHCSLPNFLLPSSDGLTSVTSVTSRTLLVAELPSSIPDSTCRALWGCHLRCCAFKLYISTIDQKSSPPILIRPSLPAREAEGPLYPPQSP